MSIDDGTLQVEITIVPAKGRKGGWHRSPAVPKVPDPPRIPRIARLMALAVKFQDMVNRGEVHDYADIARLGYVSRARLTQIMNLLLLAPEIQEEILSGEGLPIRTPATAETAVRALTKIVLWDNQRRTWMDLKKARPVSAPRGRMETGQGAATTASPGHPGDSARSAS
jgi:hypothetical protein